VMCVVILLYFLYTTTTREIISLFSCSQVCLGWVREDGGGRGGAERGGAWTVKQLITTGSGYESTSHVFCTSSCLVFAQ
jgi:hypothetical protein